MRDFTNGNFYGDGHASARAKIWREPWELSRSPLATRGQSGGVHGKIKKSRGFLLKCKYENH